MNSSKVIKARNLPFTVTYTVDNVTVRKRFTDSNTAWRFMMVSGGVLSMAFRVGM